MKGKKVITYAVSFLVALGCVSAFPMTVQADTGYEVYPNPHTMSYSNGDYEMTSQVNVSMKMVLMLIQKQDLMKFLH